jgi:D-glycero-D-manno-heptose 1,7-bisphosphate phosphatase
MGVDEHNMSAKGADARRQAVFLDRDGVLNAPVVRGNKPYPPASLEELVILPDTEASLARLKERGFALIAITNQPDVSRGSTSRAIVEQIHRRLSDSLPLDDVFVCYHDDRDHCDCRKPLPGLILQAAAKHGISLRESYMIGDRWRDVDAGSAAGCKTVLIDCGYAERAPSHCPDASVPSLHEAVNWILHRENSSASAF